MNPLRAEPPARAVEPALTAVVREGLAPVSLGLGLLYLVFAAAHPWTLPADLAVVMSGLALATSVLLLALAAFLRRGTLPLPAVYPVAVGIGVLVLANTLLHQYLLADPLQTTNLVLLVLGAGFLLLSTRWYALVVLLAGLGWLAVALSAPFSGAWTHFGFALLTASVLGGVIHTVRRRNLARLEGLRLEEGARRDEMERAQESLETRVAERTAELRGANEALQAEVAGRLRVEEQLRRSEEYLRSVVENVQDVITILDSRGAIRYESPSVTRVFGYRPEELVGRSAFELIHPEDLPLALAEFERAMETPGYSSSLEVRFRHKDGSWRNVETVGQNLTHNEQVGGFIITTRDITPRRRIEEEQREAEKMEAVGTLAGGIAHDFNNLLTVITGRADLLLGEMAGRDPRREDVGEILRAAERAAGLTRQLLAVGRRQPLRLAVLDLNRLLASAAGVLRESLRPDIELAIEPCERVWPVRTDGGQIEQALLRLAQNAQDAMPDGGRLRVATRCTPESVVLEVQDTGRGMDAATRARVFEPFFTTKEVGRGSGLGLSAVYGIVAQSGGSIEVESEPGMGTTFRISLPAVEEGEDDTPPPPAPGVAGKTVLLVEDEDGVRLLARRVLERDGYAVLECRSGEDALRRLERHPRRVDLVVTDVVMPGMGGPELVRRLSRRTSGLRVLYISGYTGDMVLGEDLSTPDVSFLQKPFSPEALLVRVREALGPPTLEPPNSTP